MTKEMKEKIFQEYFRPAKMIGRDVYYGDLRITSLGLGAEVCGERDCLKESGLVLYPLYEEPGVCWGDVTDGELNKEGFKKAMKGELEEWQIIEFIITTVNMAEHFIRLNAIRNDEDEFLEIAPEGFDARKRWYKKNLSTMYYRVPATLITSEKGVSYIVDAQNVDFCYDEETEWEGVSHVQVTELIDGHKTRQFSRWFHKEAWEITYYAPSQL